VSDRARRLWGPASSGSSRDPVLSAIAARSGPPEPGFTSVNTTDLRDWVTVVTRPSISAFFPCYNDAKTIALLVLRVEEQLRCLTGDYEIVVVNDGSVDDSAGVLDDLRASVPTLRVITHATNQGYGAALRSGFRASTKSLVFYTDGDGQYGVDELRILAMLMTDDTDFVNGMKMTRRDPFHRIFIGNLHNFITRWLFWLPVSDVDCDFRLVRRSVVERLDLRSNSGSICVELVKKAQRAGAQFREVSVHHYAREWGESQFFRPTRILRTYLDLARMWIDLMVADRFRR
jgi:glycosyltransferase involved in cell wall biosynthesis